MMRINRKARGQALIEAVCTAMILIPIALCLLDFMVLVIANAQNDSCAKTAARAAANQADQPTALAAAKKAVSALHTSAIITGVSMPGFFMTLGPAVSQFKLKLRCTCLCLFLASVN
jgi:choline-glycine betaine transporter